MFEQIKDFLKPLSFPEDDDKSRTASLLHTILSALLIIFVGNSIVAVFFNGDLSAIVLNISTIFLAAGLLYTLQRGYVIATSRATIIIFFVLVSLVALLVSGATITVITSYFILVLLAGLLTGRKWSIAFMFLTLLVWGITIHLQENTSWTPPLPGTLLVNATSAAGNLIALTVILNLTLRILDQSFTRLRTGNVELQQTQATLERRVLERTRALETAASVSRNLSVILDEAQLVQAVVTQLQNAFNFYHVHIYLLDKNKNQLVMAGGTGEAGKQLLAQGHKLSPGQGLVGRAAAANAAVLVPDVSQEPGWLPNPLLPGTQSEAAVPIAAGGDVLGVLDVQENQVNGLSAEDVELILLVAGQIAIALRNAQFIETTRQRAVNEAKINEIRLKIQETTDVESALQVAVRELGEALNASRTAVRMQSGSEKNGHTAQE